jgi:pimeloyl-ACP methyl ester carboxylesterase
VVFNFNFRTVRAGVLDIAYESYNEDADQSVVLLHGFPYDARCFDEVAPRLAAEGLRVVVPYLRGFGQTRFLNEQEMRSGQQAALAQDLLDLIAALNLRAPIVAGFDWGGRAACIVAALHPERVAGLVSVDGYNIQNLALASRPSPPTWERSYWYQWYFQTERGRRGLVENRTELCALLWETWSPRWTDARQAFRASAVSLDNPDFVEVVIHSYRHRFGAVEGHPRYQPVEDAIALEPKIDVPTVVLESGADGIEGPPAEGDDDMFTGYYERRQVKDAGHNLPQETPDSFVSAVLEVLGRVV